MGQWGWGHSKDGEVWEQMRLEPGQESARAGSSVPQEKV